MRPATKSCETLLSYGIGRPGGFRTPDLLRKHPQALSPNVVHARIRQASVQSCVAVTREPAGGTSNNPETFSDQSDVVPGSIPPGQSARARREAGHAVLLITLLTLRSSRSRPPSDRDRAGARRTWPPPQTPRLRSRRRSRCRHALAPASCRRAGYRCRRASPQDLPS